MHSGGVGLNNSTGLDFFTGTDALSLRLDSALDDLENIAAAAGPGLESGVLGILEGDPDGLETILDSVVHGLFEILEPDGSED